MSITDEQAIEMGRGVAAWDGFARGPGMRFMEALITVDGVADPVGPIRLCDLSETACGIAVPGYAHRMTEGNVCRDAGVPDLRDRPTQAGVLERIEKALSAPCHIQPTAYFVTDNGRKCWRVHCAGVFAHAGSRAEAIAAAVRELSADPPWYLDEKTRETGERWPAACECFVNLDPDDYPDQPGCDRCGWAKQDHR